MQGTGTMIALLLGLLAASAGIALWAWHELGEVELSMHGWIALAAGASVTLILGVGLMWLAFYSHRKGYDDEAGTD